LNQTTSSHCLLAATALIAATFFSGCTLRDAGSRLRHTPAHTCCPEQCCPDNYCQKCLPPVACTPATTCGEYCKKPLPCPPCTGEAVCCDDYCPKCWSPAPCGPIPGASCGRCATCCQGR